jgi:hypothetical protein
LTVSAVSGLKADLRKLEVTLDRTTWLLALNFVLTLVIFVFS